MKSCAKALGDFNLIYGIGNVGREDDGLGWAMVDELESLYPDKQFIRHYQLFFEDVALLQEVKMVLFIDASKRIADGVFSIETIRGQMDLSFTSHSISLPSIAAMSWLCYKSCPEIWLLSIQGYRWELKQGLSERARRNFQHALDYITQQGIQPTGTAVFENQANSHGGKHNERKQ